MTASYYKDTTGLPSVSISKEFLTEILFIIYFYCAVKMVEQKDVRSSSPARNVKLQLTVEQPLTGECWIPPKKDIPHLRAKEEPQQDGGRGEITFRIKNQKPPETLGQLKQTWCTQDLETPQRLSQSCV